MAVPDGKTERVETVSVWPVGKEVAECEPVVLRSGPTTRLVFHPRLVVNKQNASQPVIGDFIYQRRKKNDEWEDLSSSRINAISPGTGIKLSLKPWEAHTVAEVVLGLDVFFKQNGGLPNGKVTVDLSTHPKGLDLSGDAATRARRVIEASGVEGLASVLEWASEFPDVKAAVEELSRLKINDLQKINTITGLSTLKRVVSLWDREKNNQEEKFWQQKLKRHPFVLSQVLAAPLVIIDGTMYVGGKGIQNTGGKYPDFILQNVLTHNTLVVEIKEPRTPLLGGVYRKPDIYNVSDQLSGAVMQVMKYRDEFLKDYWSLKGRSKINFRASNPPCLVVIGNREQLISDDEVEAFELYRGGLRDVQVVTFDELFEKTRMLICILEGEAEVPR